MGRGRAKAKQTKVARDLKYSSQNPDLAKLQQELSADHSPGSPASPGPANGSDDDGYDSDYTQDEDDYSRWERSS